MKVHRSPQDSPHGEFLLDTWSRLGGRRPRALLALRSRADRKNALYRLIDAADDGGSVFAKLCRGPNAGIEPVLYADTLSRLPVGVPRCYGTVPADDGVWVFLEDLGRRRVDPTQREHRELAARWLARMHVTASRLDLEERVPARGPTHYRETLRAGRRGILASLGNPAFDDEDRAVADAALAQLDEIETCWDGIESFCADLPRTLVHGDFCSKNVHLSRRGEVTELLVMDWETAGWGVPAPDLGSARSRDRPELVDLDVYRREVSGRWPHFDSALVARLGAVGGVFRRLAAIEWATHNLRFPWPAHAISQLRCYREGLELLLRERSWVA